MEISQISVAQIGLKVEAPSEADYRDVGLELFKAFESIGFVYIKDHGVEQDLIKSSMKSSEKFFLLPKTEKDKFERDEIIQQGYVEPGREVFTDTTKDTITEIRESWEVTKIEGELATFPDQQVPEMRDNLTKLARQSRELTFRLLRALAISLNLNPEYFVEREKMMFTPKCITKLRSLYYPPIEGPVQPGVIRCGEHTDYGLVTLLYQDSMGGLEVKGVDHKWINAKPIEGSVLINCGDMLEIFTSGRLPATMHRVVVPEEEIKRKASRQSIVFFVHPDHETPIHPLPGFPNLNKLGKYQETTALDYVNMRFSQNYRY